MTTQEGHESSVENGKEFVPGQKLDDMEQVCLM